MKKHSVITFGYYLFFVFSIVFMFFFKKAFFNYIYCASEVIEAQVSFYEKINKETGLPLTVVEIDNFQKNVKIGDIVKILLANSESYEIRTLEPEKMVVSFSGKRTILANNQLHELPGKCTLGAPVRYIEIVEQENGVLFLGSGPRQSPAVEASEDVYVLLLFGGVIVRWWILSSNED